MGKPVKQKAGKLNVDWRACTKKNIMGTKSFFWKKKLGQKISGKKIPKNLDKKKTKAKFRWIS